MAAEYSGADAIRFYHSGAASIHGTAQRSTAVDDLNGLYRAGTEVSGLGVHRTGSCTALTVEYAAPGNGVGLGTLRAVTGDSVAWTPPSGTEGAEVSIAQGETKVVLGADVDKYVRIYRHSTSDISGECYCTLVDVYNTGISINDILNAQAQAATQDFWVLFVTNHSASSVTDLRLWKGAETDHTLNFSGPLTLNADGSYIDIGTLSLPGDLAPWNSGTDFAGGLQMGTFTAGETKAFAVLRIPPAWPTPSEPAAREQTVMEYRYTLAAVDYDGSKRGLFRVYRDSWDVYGLWCSDDADPDLTAQPDETFASLPYTSTLTVAAGSTGHAVIRKQNKGGLWDENTEIHLLPRNGDGSVGYLAPSDPDNLLLLAQSGGVVQLTGEYRPAPDGANRADTWVVWFDKGADPDPDLDTPTGFFRMGDKAGIELLEYDSDAYLDGADVRAIARTRRYQTGTGTEAGTQTTQLPASGAGTIVTTDSFADWGASGYAAIGNSRTGIREVVAFTKTNSTTLTIGAGDRAEWGTVEGAGTDAEYTWPVEAVDSVNTTILTDAAETAGPGVPIGTAFYSRASSQWQDTPSTPLSTVYIDQTNNIYYSVADGSVSLYADTQLVWRAIYSSEIKHLYIPSELDVVGTAVSGAATGTDHIEVGAWNGTRELFVVVDSVREMRVDVTNTNLEVEDMFDAATPTLTAQAPYLQQDQAVYFFAWDDETADWIPYANQRGDRMTVYADRLDNTLTQAQVEAL